MRKQTNNGRIEAEEVRHSVPAVFVQVRDIGYGCPGIKIYCNKSSHQSCLDELMTAIRSGGRILQRSPAWYELIKKFENEDKFNVRH